MSWQQREQERRVVVASVPTSSEADFLRISLAVRGIEAMVSPASVYPSVDFVEGLRITVRASDEDDAREILGLLGVDVASPRSHHREPDDRPPPSYGNSRRRTPMARRTHARLRRTSVLMFTAALLVLVPAGSAFACGGLVTSNGTVSLTRTTTLAAYHDGVEHYVTAFEFAGADATEVGSIVPLPASRRR